MAQDALLAAYRWLVGGAGVALRLLPILLVGLLGLFALSVLARRFDPSGRRRALAWMRRRRPEIGGTLGTFFVAVFLGAGLVQARKLVVARREVVARSTASRREEPSLSGVTQYAPAVAVLEDKTYTRTLTLPPDFLTRVGAEGVGVLAPYLSDPSADEVLRLRDVFKRSGTDVVFTREVVRRDETPVTAQAAEVTLRFAAQGTQTGRHYEAAFDATYRFRNPRPAPAAMRFAFPLPQGGGTLQEFSIEADGRRIADPDEKGLYAWTGNVPAGGEVGARVRYRISGAGAYDYALGSERRRIGEFRLAATADGPVQYGKSGIYPTRVQGKLSEWTLRDVITAQNVALVFPRADIVEETFEKTLWWLPAVLALFGLGAARLAPRASVRSTLAFGLGLLGVPVLSAYAPPLVATLVGAVLAGALGGAILPRSKIFAPVCALLACAFLTVEHGGLFAWLLTLAAVGWWTIRGRSRS